MGWFYYVLPELFIVVWAIRRALQACNKNRADFVLALFIDASCTRQVLFKSPLRAVGMLSNLESEGIGQGEQSFLPGF